LGNMVDMLPEDAVCKIFEFAYRCVPVVCLVERSYRNQPWQTTIVGRMKQWRCWRHAGFKDVLALSPADFPFQHDRRTCRPILEYVFRLGLESREHGFKVFMPHDFVPPDRRGSVRYESTRLDCLQITWSPDAGAERAFRMYDLGAGFGNGPTIFPPGFYDHVQQLLTGNDVDIFGNAFAHVTTLIHQSHALVVFRSILVPSALKLCSHFCRTAAQRSSISDVHTIKTMASDMIPAILFRPAIFEPGPFVENAWMYR